MALDPITALSGVVTSVIDRVWPDPSVAAQAKAELAKMQVSGELANVAGQLEINKAEATNPSLFVSGWRPSVGWICSASLAYSFVGFPLLVWWSTYANIPAPPALDTGTLLTVLGGMLGLGGLRTVEKINNVAAK